MKKSLIDAASAVVAAAAQDAAGRWIIGGDGEALICALQDALAAEGKKLASAKMVDEAIELWNAMAAATKQGNPAHVLPAVRKLNPANRKALALRLEEFGPAGWRACVEAIFKSAHCRGINDRGWKADISYLLQPKGSNKTINGGWPADYQEKSRGGQRVGPSGRGDQRVDSLRSFDQAIRRRAAPVDGREGGGQDGGGDARTVGRGPGQALLGLPPGGAHRPR